ncbi:MAG: N,N-dimethylformamidase beta subunit family domain-containing protein [Chloroflexota bacterium]
MLVGYVSDERYVAVADASIEFERDGESVAVTHSTASGGVYADLSPGHYRVTVVKRGFGSKSVEISIAPGVPAHQFRLLSDGLLGYMWPKWVRSGDRAEFRVHAVEPYRLELWRYGWQKELVRPLGWFDEHGPRAVMQITPDGDYTQSGVGWNTTGYGHPHLTQFATGPERSGLYYLHAEGQRSGAFFSFPWVVAPARPSAPIAVIASTNTWNAYNNFGGRSNYVNTEALPPRPTVNARQDLPRYSQARAFRGWGFPDDAYAPLSFERPEPGNHVPRETQVSDPIRGRVECALAPAEWRTLGWLEREQYAYDLYAEQQLHDGIVNLDAYRVLILSVHPEYWSRKMYERVKEWVYDRGGKLMYLGGNGINCEVELSDQATMRCKSYQAPATESGGEFESRFRRTVESEASLLGVAYDDRGIMTGAPFRVVDSSHWVFAGTGLHDGDIFGTESLHERCPGGASGHETDKISRWSPPGTTLLAKGLNPEDGGAEMAYYELPAGGATFSASSIIWPASLLVDQHVSRITRNVLERFLG